MRTYLRFKDLAIDLAIEVLPTPGGPENNKIGPLLTSLISRSPSVDLSALSFRTARNSKMRSLTFSKP